MRNIELKGWLVFAAVMQQRNVGYFRMKEDQTPRNVNTDYPKIPVVGGYYPTYK